MVDQGLPRFITIQQAALVAGRSVRQVETLIPLSSRQRGRVSLTTLLELAVARIERDDNKRKLTITAGDVGDT